MDRLLVRLSQNSDPSITKYPTFQTGALPFPAWRLNELYSVFARLKNKMHFPAGCCQAHRPKLWIVTFVLVFVSEEPHCQ